MNHRLFSRSGVEAPPPKLIKINIEKGEQQLIMGAAVTLKIHKPISRLDFHSNQRIPFVADLLKPFGYFTSGANPIIAISKHN